MKIVTSFRTWFIVGCLVIIGAVATNLIADLSTALIVSAIAGVAFGVASFFRNRTSAWPTATLPLAGVFWLIALVVVLAASTLSGLAFYALAAAPALVVDATFTTVLALRNRRARVDADTEQSDEFGASA